MNFSLRLPVAILGLILLGATAGQISAQDSSVTTSDPGEIALKKLFKEADTVALVEVMAGDNESYKIPLYKARVIRSFKGTPAGSTIYFGPYIGTRIGVQYFLFLNAAKEPIVPTSTAHTAYGPQSYWQISHDGYGSMMSSYECVFDVKDDTQQCDYGVRVCTNFVTLPHGTEVFPPMKIHTLYGCRWTRKKSFLALMDEVGRG